MGASANLSPRVSPVHLQPLTLRQIGRRTGGPEGAGHDGYDLAVRTSWR